MNQMDPMPKSAVRSLRGRARSAAIACLLAGLGVSAPAPAAAADAPLVPLPEAAPPASDPSPAAPQPGGTEDSPGVERLSDERGRTQWSYVRRAVTVRVKPDRRSRARGALRRYTYYGRTDLVIALARSGSWTRVRYSGLGSRTGWVPSNALSRQRLTDSWVVVDRGRRRLRAYRGDRLLLTAPVGVGARGSPTPGGRFFIRERLVPRDRNGTYGVLAFGLSAYSRHRTDWAGGGQVGIHGTNHPGLIPGRISNGCVRMRNADVRRLDRIVGQGTPVQVR